MAVQRPSTVRSVALRSSAFSFAQGKPMPHHVARGNARRARLRARVEHAFAAQKRRFALVIRTVGKARATAKLALANLAYNFARLAWPQGRAV